MTALFRAVASLFFRLAVVAQLAAGRLALLLVAAAAGAYIGGTL